jgi:hypothetical protein
MSKSFRKLTNEVASQVMDYCEANHIDFDIWNAEEVWFGNSNVVEFGCDWSKIPLELY